MGQVVVVVGVADPVAFPLLRLNLDREHARQGGEGRVEVGGGSGTVDARTRRRKTSRPSLLVERKLVEGSELEDGVAEVGVLLPIPVGAQAVRFKRSLKDLSRLDLQQGPNLKEEPRIWMARGRSQECETRRKVALSESRSGFSFRGDFTI